MVYAEIQSEKARFKVETVAEGLRHPWGMVKLPDGAFLVTERGGQLRVIRDGRLLDSPVGGVPEVYAKGQGGLLDIELHPDYLNNGWIYLAFSKPGDGGMANTSIVRARFDGRGLKDLETVFEAPSADHRNAGVHFGCRMRFDNQGFLYFSIGDRGTMQDAQRLDCVNGKVHRLHDDGKIPEDNPYAKQVGAAGSIWSYGNRNIQGMDFEPTTGQLYTTEHGPRGGDELNSIKKGVNYGWPIITYGIHYNGKPITEKTEAPGMEQPVIQWTPSIAASGLSFYTGDAFPAWKGNLFAGALAHQKLVRMEMDGGKVIHQEILLERSGRIREVRDFGDGALYVVYDDPGKVIRLVPAES